MGLSYYVIDTETNGMKAGYHETIEISIIRCADRHQVSKTIKPDFPERSNPISLEITGRTLIDLMQGEDKKAVVDVCQRFFDQDGSSPEHRCIIAHNYSFDKRFCHALWGSVGLEFPAACWLCTRSLAKAWAKKTGIVPENYQLSTVVKTAGIKAKPGIHGAEPDAQNTFMFWQKVIKDGVDHLPFLKREKHNLNK